MANLAAALKAEISRLARKEIKAQVAPVQKKSARHRREIAALRQRVATLERTIASVRSRQQKSTVKKTPTETVRKRSLSAKSIKSHRKGLGMTATNYARFIGVQRQTIYNWEHGRTRPRPEQDAALIAFQKIGKGEARRRLGVLLRADMS